MITVASTSTQQLSSFNTNTVMDNSATSVDTIAIANQVALSTKSKNNNNNNSKKNANTKTKVTKHISLESIYNSIPPPAQLNETDNTIPPIIGFRPSVKLYQYQQRSLCQMIKRETKVTLFADPLCNTNENSNVANTSYFMDEKGGLLCEDMGTGKTIICIALILCFKGKLAVPPPMSSKQYYAVDNLGKPLKDVVTNEVPTLFQLCAFAIKEVGHMHRNLPTNLFPDHTLIQQEKRSIMAKDHFQYQFPDHLQQYIDSIPFPFYYHYPNENATRRSDKKLRRKCLRTRIWLSTATLIILPSNLLDQWLAELYKHTLDNSLKIFNWSSQKEIPSSEELCKYDVVFITLPQLRSQCSATNTSPLLQIHWQRIFVDEELPLTLHQPIL